ncbi:MAG: hypothetical protein HC889_17355 [Synechococcaceae cyanobacterium SM1_2_3]|nr:hypothetical protein [Synechococcaceae cyanobacterium SM1_2_3]
MRRGDKPYMEISPTRHEFTEADYSSLPEPLAKAFIGADSIDGSVPEEMRSEINQRIIQLAIGAAESVGSRLGPNAKMAGVISTIKALEMAQMILVTAYDLKLEHNGQNVSGRDEFERINFWSSYLKFFGETYAGKILRAAMVKDGKAGRA